MTADKAIECFKQRMPGCTMCGTRELYECAIAALTEQAARINPKPLTLDELKERDGKPVWVKEITLEPIDGDHWGIVDVNLVCPGSFGMGAIISPATDGKSKFAITPFSEYDKTHVAYDHPPKEDKPID